MRRFGGGYFTIVCWLGVCCFSGFVCWVVVFCFGFVVGLVF